MIDAGFDGTITPELKNHNQIPLVIDKGECVGQIVFKRLDEPAQRPYGHEDLGSHYQGQTGPQPPDSTNNFYSRRAISGEF